MAEDVLGQLLSNQREILDRLKRLDERLDTLGSESFGKRKSSEPEAILTCVQCSAEYKESENGKGSCKYHTHKLKGWNRYTYGCCDASSSNYEAAKSLTGCTKGKHRSEHHEEYSYSAYFSYMNGLSNNAKELWLLCEALDPISEGHIFAEVGLAETNTVYVMVGENRISPLAVREMTLNKLEEFNDGSIVILERKGDSGWIVRCSLIKESGVPKAFELSVKPTLSDTYTIKRVYLSVDGSDVRKDRTENVLDLQSNQEVSKYSLPNNDKQGPFLDSGVDYSKNRKINYDSEQVDGCPLEVRQRGKSKVESTMGDNEGSFLNKFISDFQITNPSDERIAVTEIKGHYKDKGGEWTACDVVQLGVDLYRGSYQWEEYPNFNINERSTINITVNLAIRIHGKAPQDNFSGKRAHHSLPQPMILRVTLKDHNGGSVSVLFEQGNTILDLPNEEKRAANWAKGGNLIGYCFVDDADDKKRYDIALFYDDKGILTLRQEGQSYYLRSTLIAAALKARVEKKREYLIEKVCKDVKAYKTTVWALVDLEKAIVYGLKIEMSTSTSSAISYWPVPAEVSPSDGCIIIDPNTVIPGGNATVHWKLPRASKSDRIYIYARNGIKNIPGLYATNKDGCENGSSTIKVPSVPGDYEIRYCPSWLASNTTGSRSDGYWGRVIVSVKS